MRKRRTGNVNVNVSENGIKNGKFFRSSTVLNSWESDHERFNSLLKKGVIYVTR